MAFCPSHQQHVFIYKRIVPHTALHCLPSRSPVTHVPGIIQSVTPLPISCTIVGWIHRPRGPPDGGVWYGGTIESRIETKVPIFINNFLNPPTQNLERKACCQLSRRGNCFDTLSNYHEWNKEFSATHHGKWKSPFSACLHKLTARCIVEVSTNMGDLGFVFLVCFCSHFYLFIYVVFLARLRFLCVGCR